MNDRWPLPWFATTFSYTTDAHEQAHGFDTKISCIRRANKVDSYDPPMVIGAPADVERKRERRTNGEQQITIYRIRICLVWWNWQRRHHWFVTCQVRLSLRFLHLIVLFSRAIACITPALNKVRFRCKFNWFVAVGRRQLHCFRRTYGPEPTAFDNNFSASVKLNNRIESKRFPLNASLDLDVFVREDDR